MGQRFLVVASALVFLASSCKKDDGSPTLKELVGTYQFTKMTYLDGKSAEKDVTDDYLNACAKDDLIVLSASRTFTALDAGKSCGNGNVVSEWAIIGASTLKLADDIYSIRKFDGNHLELSLTGNNRGVSNTLVKYYVRQ